MCFNHVIIICFFDLFRLKLADFGISRRMSSDTQRLRTNAGTLAYKSPEQILGDYDKRCDVWALGVIAYQLCTLWYPFMESPDIPEAQLIYNIQNCDPYPPIRVKQSLDDESFQLSPFVLSSSIHLLSPSYSPRQLQFRALQFNHGDASEGSCC